MDSTTSKTVTPNSGEQRIGNWGRWGEDDERGVMNLLTPDVVLSSLATPRRGAIYQLGQLLQQNGQPRSPGLRGHIPAPLLHFQLRTGLDVAATEHADPEQADFTADHLSTPVHAATTHIDALGHVLHDKRFYNGYAATTGTSAGLSRCGVDKIGPIVARGVMLDVARAKEVDVLPSGYSITVEDLEATLERQQIEIRPGDAVLVRTGLYSVWDRDPDEWARPAPGVGTRAAGFLARHDVVLVGADNRGIEPLEMQPTMPVHRLFLVHHGIHHLEMLNLEELSRDEVWEFLLVVAPLRITGGTGSPVSPFAIA